LSVTGDHKEHTSSVFHFNDRKVFLDALSYAWIQAVDEYLKEVIGQPVDKKVWSFFFLLDQGTIWRGNVSYINLSSASIQSMEYMCAGPGVVDGKQFTRLLCSMQILG
jgi:hypothetical protein